MLRMRYRPELIVILAYLALVIAAVATLVVTLSDTALETLGVVAPLLAIALVASAIQVFVTNVKRFAVILPFQVGSILVVATAIESFAPAISLAIVVALILNTGVRLPARYSLALVLVIIAVRALLWEDVGTVGWEDRLGMTLIELMTGAFCAVTVHYRESLVDCRNELEQERVATQNVSAANESFVEQLPEMRRQAAESERLRITRELHDSIGYSMTNVVAMMNASQYLFDTSPEKVREYCSRTKDLAVTSMEETRATLYRLRSIEYRPHESPSSFFHKLCGDFEEATGVSTECHPGNLKDALPGRVFHLLLRGVQVGFINAVRHGRATLIQLFFWIDESELRMTIWNSAESSTFVSAGTSEGIGLSGIRERLNNVGGAMHSEYSGGGYSLVIAIPRRELFAADATNHDRRRSASLR